MNLKKLLILPFVLLVSATSYSQGWNQLQVPYTRNLYGCWFDAAHPDTGVAVGWYVQNLDRLPFGFFTTDGGNTITNASLFQVYFYASSDVWFTTSYNGVVVGNGIIQTTDGGSNWNLIVDAATTQAGILENVMFSNSTEGYAVGQRYDFSYTSYEGMIYTTNNAGGSWTDYTVSQEVNNENTLLHAVFSTGNGVVYAGAENVFGGSTLFKSVNDGVTWAPMTFTESIWSLYFVSSDTGFAATANGLYKTTDAGLNWNSILPTASALHAIQIKNGFGFAAGENGVIYNTTDNGNTWTLLSSPTTNTINDIAVISPGLAYAVGAGGTYLKYTNPVGMNEIIADSDFRAWVDENHELIIKWNTSRAGETSIELISMNGNVIQKPSNGFSNAGQHTIRINLESFSNGIYFLKFRQGNKNVTEKIVLIK